MPKVVAFVICILKPSDHLNKGEEGYCGAMLDNWVSDTLTLKIMS